MKKIDFKKFFSLFFLLIPVGLVVYFFVSENGFIDLIENFSKFNVFWLTAAVVCQIMNLLIDGYILYRFVNNYDRKYSLLKSFRATAVGQFYSMITPGGVAGQPMQVYFLGKQKVDSGVSSSCLMQKFLVYQTVFAVYSLTSMMFNLDLFSGNLKSLMVSLAVFGLASHVLVVIFILMFSFSERLTCKVIDFCLNILFKIKIIKNLDKTKLEIEEKLNKFHESNVRLYKNKKILIVSSVLTVIQLSLIFSIPYMIYRAFNFYGASIFDMITAQAIVTTVSSFVPVPGGSGAAEGSFYLFFSMFFTENTIKPAILLWRIVTYFLNIIMFAPFSNVNKIKG